MGRAGQDLTTFVRVLAIVVLLPPTLKCQDSGSGRAADFTMNAVDVLIEKVLVIDATLLDYVSGWWILFRLDADTT